jgi:hypothetical protein
VSGNGQQRNDGRRTAGNAYHQGRMLPHGGDGWKRFSAPRFYFSRQRFVFMVTEWKRFPPKKSSGLCDWP